MCGILVSVDLISDGRQRQDFADTFSNLQAANAARGPDEQNLFHIDLASPLSNHNPKVAETSLLALDFFASELRLRGNRPVVQPHVQGGDVLCWNGEVFEGLDIPFGENDGVQLFHRLRQLETAEEITDFFGTIEGPYAFVYYQSKTRRLFFARDPLGRRSLLVLKHTAFPQLILASVSCGRDTRYEVEEVSTSHIYCLDLAKMSSTELIMLQNCVDFCLIALPRNSPGTVRTKFTTSYAEPARICRDLPQELLPQVQTLDHTPVYLVDTVDGFISQLDRSVMLRTENIPPLGDSQARVAVLFSGGIDSTVVAFLAHRHIPIDEPIDLLNVAFENPTKLRARAFGNVDGLSKKQKKKWEKENGVKSFAHPQDHQYMVPDRETGFKQVDELRLLTPERTWNFVEINVPYPEYQAARSKIEELMFPRRTVMDLSLALALYFASRGQGQVRSSAQAQPVPYTSRARVLLNGLGSDELLGGYGRHRTTFQTGGWESIIRELQLEVDRIPTRNLGRDDRVTSSHGKETRYPFLSLTVVNFLANLPVHLKMDPRLETGVGDKMLLRLAARKLGLIGASTRRKKAMQFGSHSARMEGERRGDDILDC